MAAFAAALASSIVLCRRLNAISSIACTSAGVLGKRLAVIVKYWLPQKTSTPMPLSLFVFVDPSTMMCTPFPLGEISVKLSQAPTMFLHRSDQLPSGSC
ncbi:hypothetical protein A9977_14560 [Variovorax sp. UMC13]|nr:hypothetical protein [Variovorax sp. UMC13]